ncbi:uncharacterized protein B0T23DRAFT_379015 [Neurospora hispaniola]|uniref:Uncharacterized protein n=1 Tax=Neurospora hispaniola TaxID=588809 RepID=A0AAJ0I776_9PEZI|nr:hypothetical protein B0T23DRAFT_379015 [Neurospora hispaniola]
MSAVRLFQVLISDLLTPSGVLPIRTLNSPPVSTFSVLLTQTTTKFPVSSPVRTPISRQTNVLSLSADAPSQNHPVVRISSFIPPIPVSSPS